MFSCNQCINPLNVMCLKTCSHFSSRFLIAGICALVSHVVPHTVQYTLHISHAFWHAQTMANFNQLLCMMKTDIWKQTYNPGIHNEDNVQRVLLMKQDWGWQHLWILPLDLCLKKQLPQIYLTQSVQCDAVMKLLKHIQMDKDSTSM